MWKTHDHSWRKSHILVQLAHGRITSKRIYSPGSSWNILLTKCIFDPLQPSGHGVNDRVVCVQSFVWHCPTPEYEFNLFTLQEPKKQFPLIIRSVIPPPLHERNLCEDEASLWVVFQQRQHISNDALHLTFIIAYERRVSGDMVEWWWEDTLLRMVSSQPTSQCEWGTKYTSKWSSLSFVITTQQQQKITANTNRRCSTLDFIFLCFIGRLNFKNIWGITKTVSEQSEWAHLRWIPGS